jgi:hypothetical protein
LLTLHGAASSAINLGGGGDEFLGPGHFLSLFKNGAETPTPFFFPSALSSGGFILYHPKLHTSERERWDCCVFHIVYIISFGPEIPLMTHPWLFQQSRKGSDHLFFSFPRLPRKKTEMMSRKFRAICNNSNFMAILYIKNNAGRCCSSSCGGATVKWNSAYYVITQTHIQERYWEIWKSWLNNRLQKRAAAAGWAGTIQREQREKVVWFICRRHFLGFYIQKPRNIKKRQPALLLTIGTEFKIKGGTHICVCVLVGTIVLLHSLHIECRYMA